MKLRVTVRLYRLPLRRPLVTARANIVEREGLILGLMDERGEVGEGEAAPISWIDDESLEDAAADLARLGDSIAVSAAALERDDAARIAWLEELGRSFCASARTALDTASLDLCARRAGISAAARLGARRVLSVPRSALVVESSPDDVAAAVRSRVARGFRVVKLKVGAAKADLDVARIVAARAELPETAMLRLDANAAWSFDVARYVLRAIGSTRLDYVEEPLAEPTPDSLAELRAATDVPLAIDESLDRVGGVDAVVSRPCCDVVVMKPARVGGPTRAVELGRRLLASDIRVVLTDAIETAVGRGAVVHAASALAAHGASEAVGLGGLELFVADPDTKAGDSANDVPTLVATGPGLAVAREPRAMNR